VSSGVTHHTSDKQHVVESDASSVTGRGLNYGTLFPQNPQHKQAGRQQVFVTRQVTTLAQLLCQKYTKTQLL
jgi:hypothetical protein